MKNTYLITDCLVLHNILKGRTGATGSIEFYEEVVHKATKILEFRELTEWDIEEILIRWLLKNFLGEGHKIHKFLYETEFNNVALYINNTKLNIFVQWRLKICK